MYVITDETTHTSITDGVQYWGIPKSGTTTLVRDGYLYVYNPSFDRLEFPRALISIPATNSDAELAAAISFMTAPAGGGGGTVTGAESGVYLNTGKVRLGGALLENVELSGAFNVAFLNQSVSVGTNAPYDCAAFQVDSTNKGALLPRMTKAQREAIASPKDGLIVYQTDGYEQGLWVYAGSWQWMQRLMVEEHFLQSATGETIQFNSTVNGGAQITLTGSGPVASEASTPLRQRYGVVTAASATTSVSRALLYTTGFYQLTNGAWDNIGAFYLEWEGSESAAYDPATDSARRFLGLLANPTGGTLLTGITIRPPYSTETQTYKNVILQGGLENAGAHFDSGMPYNTGLIRYKKHGILWDGVNLHFINSSETDVQIRSIANFGSQFPLIASVNWQFGIHINRPNLAPAGTQRTLNVDVIRRWVYQVPYKYKA